MQGSIAIGSCILLLVMNEQAPANDATDINSTSARVKPTLSKLQNPYGN